MRIRVSKGVINEGWNGEEEREGRSVENKCMSEDSRKIHCSHFDRWSHYSRTHVEVRVHICKKGESSNKKTIDEHVFLRQFGQLIF